MHAWSSGPHPGPHAEQSTLRPSAQGGWIGRARRIFAVWRCLLNRITCGDVLTGLLSAAQAVVPGRRQPIGQDREGLPARPTDCAPHPDACALVIVSLTEPPAVADDRVVSASGTSPRQEVQGDHPGSMLSLASGSAIKRITAGVKACRRPSLPSFDLGIGLHPPGKVSLERKRILLSIAGCYPSLIPLAGIKP